LAARFREAKQDVQKHFDADDSLKASFALRYRPKTDKKLLSIFRYAFHTRLLSIIRSAKNCASAPQNRKLKLLALACSLTCENGQKQFIP